MKNNSPGEIFNKIKNCKNILMTLHKGPDGDSLAGCCAMKYFLERDFDCKVKIISFDKLPYELNELRFSKEIEFGKKLEDFKLEKFDCIIFVDTGSMKITHDNEETLKKIFTINVDHHETNSYFANLNYVDSSKHSACSVLMHLLKEWQINFDKELSTRLLLGIYTDSGFFSHSAEAIREAAFLIDKKVDYVNEIVNPIKYNFPLNIKKYFSLITDAFKIVEFENYKIGISTVSKEEIEKTGVNLSEVRGGINYLQEIGGIDFLFTLAELNNEIKGSFRSRKNIDVSLFAVELGGGGHKLAAAFTLEKMPLEKAEEKVLEAIKKVGVHKI
jgi:phosphoesterase RecJ-like protein